MVNRKGAYLVTSSEWSISVVVPVRNMASHVDACVRALVPQLGDGDEVVVVDDGSSDGSGDRAHRAGARVLRNSQGGGPYRARNLAAGSVNTDALLFVDARSRARAGLLDAHRTLLAHEGAPLSCTGVEIEQTSTFAGRVTVAQDLFRIDTKVTGRGLDFYPTANLGVSRRAFEAVGGFRDIRSGADADLCWRVQQAGLGGIGVDPRILMSWVPREKVSDLLEQNYRYGKSSVYLERLHARAFARAHELAKPPPTPPAGADDQDASNIATDWFATFGAKVINLSFRAGRVRGLWIHRAIVPE